MIRYTYIFITFLCLTQFVRAQEPSSYNGNPDASFKRAQQLAFNNNYPQARDTLAAVLSKYPNYTDVQTLLGKTYSWEKQYEKARKIFNAALSTEKENKEAWMAAITNERYAKAYYIGLGLTNKALQYIKSDKDLLYLKAKTLVDLGEEKEALVLLKELVNKYPEEKEFKDYLALLREKFRTNTLAAGYRIEVFDTQYNPMSYGFVSYIKETKLGDVMGTVHYNNRFKQNGYQYEIQLFPKISSSLYLNLNYAYSSDAIFPNHIYRGEAFYMLPKEIEISLGAWHYDLGSNTAQVYTGSVSMYKKQYFLSLRPYVSPVENASPSLSGTFTARKYGKTRYHYIGLMLGYGFLPELRQLNIDGSVVSQTVFYLESQSLLVSYQFTTPSKKHIWNASAGVLRQELIATPGKYLTAVSGGLQYKFKY